LDTAHEAVEMGLGLHDADDRPAQVAEHLPETHALRIDRAAAGVFVGGEKLFARADAADRLVVAAEAPGAYTQPAQILERVADVRELPVEDRAHAFGTEDDVADAIVAVHQRAPIARR